MDERNSTYLSPIIALPLAAIAVPAVFLFFFCGMIISLVLHVPYRLACSFIGKLRG
jgi:hypothetical protein